MLARGADIGAQTLLRRAGERLRTSDVVALTAAGRMQVKLRSPLASVIWRRLGPDPILDAAVQLILSGIEAAGGEGLNAGVRAKGDELWNTSSSYDKANFVIGVGGTGGGRADASVRMLARVGEVVVHGIAISPGETAAFGFIKHQPVLLIPGRIDAAFAAWLLLGRRILDRLSGCTEEPPVIKARLTRKVASSLGLAEVVPVRIRYGEAEPIASGYLPLSALAQADGWILIPPESEGYPPGAEVVIKPWP
jgi:molybdopterin biosynthesis enzyme